MSEGSGSGPLYLIAPVAAPNGNLNALIHPRRRVSVHLQTARLLVDSTDNTRWQQEADR